MRTTRFLVRNLLAASLLAGITSCDDNEVTIPEPKPNGDALHEWFDVTVNEQIQHFNINASTGGNITGENGTIIKFMPNDLAMPNGNVVTGTVDVELIEVYDRASMVLTKKPTNGKKGDGSIGMLISGGEFYVNATQNGTALKLKSGFTIVAPTDNTGEIDQDMKKFDGLITCEGNDCDLVWEEDSVRGIDIGEFQVTGGFQTAYYVFQSKFGWTNIDRWYNDPRPKTTIYVDVPDGFDNTNCVVYLAYEGEPTALGSFDKYDKDKKLFTEHYGLIPVGLKVHFILVSIIEDEIHYAIQSSTITENHVEVIDEVHTITQEGLIDLIDELP